MRREGLMGMEKNFWKMIMMAITGNGNDWKEFERYI
jgi:hypothetical protein